MTARAVRRRRATRIALSVVAVAALAACGDTGDGQAEREPDVAQGQALFASNCAACHGPVGEGTAQGPPLVHEIYEPGHHADEAFQRAVADGVVPHHWDYGPMPAIGGLDRADVADITAYVRELQRDAGIID